MPPRPRLTAIVATLGLSRWLVPCLEALRRDGGDGVEIVLVSQERPGDPAAEALADRVLQLPRNLGFAGATNAGLGESRGEFLATVNDDAVIEPGWCGMLLDALARNADAAAAQGVNRRLDAPEIVDGCGLAWNRWWQAVQIGHGESGAAIPSASREIFGVSATAAVYRRAALEEVAGPGLRAFEERLGSYYEDVHLAVRLRAAGHRALLVPRARARHAGSVTGDRMPWRGRELIGGNRHLVLLDLLGRAYWSRLPLLLLRDVADLARALGRGDPKTAGAVVAGLLRAVRRGGRFARFGSPRLPLAELRRFRLDAEPKTS